MGLNVYLRELEALMKAVFQEISVLLSSSECDGGHTTMCYGGVYTLLSHAILASIYPGFFAI